MRYGLPDNPETYSNRVFFPVQSSVLDEEALCTHVLKDYGIPQPHSCTFLTRGDADIYRVITTTANFYLKIYRPPRTLELAEAEARFVTALSAAKIPVVTPVPRNDSCFAFQVNAPEGPRPMLLFVEAPPPLPSQLDEALLTQIGRNIALLHNISDEFEEDFGIPIIDSTLFLKERTYYVGKLLSKQDSNYLSSVSDKLIKFLRKLPCKKPDFGLCHGDLVKSNLRLTADGTITLFDFGNALKTWRVYELAVVKWSLGSITQYGENHLWDAFLEGYESRRSLPDRLSDYLPGMIVLRQIGFLGGNCATLPLRLGTEPFETGFLKKGMERLRKLVEESGI